MKKLLLSAATFFILGNCFGIHTQVFLENFDGTLGVVNGASTAPVPTSGNWFLNSTFPNGNPSSTSAPNCYRDTVPAGGSGAFNYFQTNSFDCSGHSYVGFQFNQICKISPVAQGSIEVSIDGGGSWTTLTSTHYRTNFYRPGSNNFFGVSGKNYFSSAAYGPTGWYPAQATRIPDSTWWRNEIFDISSIASNQSNVIIRFKLLNFGGSGSNTREYGWLIDDIDVEMATEAPPTISLVNTNAGTFTLGPFHFTVSVPQTGLNCCGQVLMYYSVNNGPVITSIMSNAALDLWTCTIPTFNDLDTICYYFQAINFFGVDGYSPPSFLPYNGISDPFGIDNAVNCFGVSVGIHFPVYYPFEPLNDGWYCDTLQPGSDWQWGQPTVGVTSGAFSFPNCWDVDLHNRYASNTHAYLYTPIFSINPNTSNIKLSFWKNHNVQAGRDGFRMQYNFDQGSGGVWTTLGYKNDPKSTNWYDTTITGSIPTLQEGWSGNTGGWEYCEYFLQQFIGASGQLQFRYVFDSDNFGNLDGVSIDDFRMIVPPPYDAQMIGFIKPGSSAPAGINDSVRVRIRNVGSDTLSNFPIRYYLSTAPTTIYTANFPGILAPADIIDFTLSTVYLTPTGSYGICAWTDVPNDADRSNDTTCKTSVGVPLKSLPFKDNFDGAAIWYDSSSTPTTHWELGTPNYGATNSPYSAPNSWDINLNLPYGNSASSVLISPLFDFTNKREVTMRFWQNRNLVEGDDGMRIEYTTVGGGDSGWSILDTIGPNLEHQNWYTNSAPPLQSSGEPGWSNNSFGWKESKLVLRELDSAGASVQFRFIFSSFVDPPLDGISIDNFSLKPASQIDPGIVEVVHPDIKGVAGDNDHVTVIIKNYGLTNLTACPIRYSVNNGAVVSGIENWTGNLKMYETDTFTFVAPYIVPSSYYTMCAYTVLATDGDHDNDTSCSRPFGIPRKTITFNDNFDTPPQNWLPIAIDNVTQWEMGSPNYGVTNSTHSSPTAWDINLTTEYKKDANAQLYSPIFNFTNMYNARLNFWHNWSVQSRGDGVKLEYRTSLADTAPWILLDTLKNLYESNWYNDSSNYVPLKPANWTGASATVAGNANGWVQSKMMMRELNNKGTDVQFRFVFRSNANINGSGYTVDDFTITKAPDADIAGISITNPRKIGIAGDLDTVKGWVYNAGNLPITSLNLQYSINGGPPVSCPWTGTILPGDSAFVTACTIVIPQREYSLCFFPVVANDGDHSNDTVCVDLYGVAKYNISYYDTMNTLPQDFFTLESGNEWEFGYPVSAAIYYACSPPNCWKTKIGGNHSNDRDDYLYSPFFNFSLAYKAEIRMCINFKTEPGNDGGRMDYSLDSGQTWHVLGRDTASDPRGVNWYTTNVLSETGKPAWTGNSQGWVDAVYALDTLQYKAGLVQFRIHYASNAGGNNEGLAIDNFEIYNPHRFDISPIAIDPLPNPFNMSGPQIIKVYVENKGSIDLTKFQISLTSDGVTVVNDVVNLPTPLVYRQIISHDMSIPWTPDSPARGGHDLCVYTYLPNDSNDMNRNDDTLCTMAGILDSVTVNNANNQYCNDFDGTLTKWIPVNSYTQTVHGSNWMHGRPDKATINSTYSGNESWATRLEGLYDNIDSSALYSPVFEVDSDGCYEVSFYHNFQMEDYQDGGVIEYSMDAGATWYYLGYGFDQNWYNSVFITSLSRDNTIPGVAGWTGTSNGSWVYAAHNVKFYNPTHAVFRFRFGSDPSKQMEGWAIDNFCLKKIGPCTIGINELEKNGFAMSQNFPNPASEVTTISYLIPSHGKVKLSISNILGQELQTLVDENQPAGQYMREVNVSMLAKGIYYYTLEFEGQRLVGKMIIAE